MNHPISDPIRSNTMHLLIHALVQDRIRERQREADARWLVRDAVLARRARRSTARAVLRARVIALATR